MTPSSKSLKTWSHSDVVKPKDEHRKYSDYSSLNWDESFV